MGSIDLSHHNLSALLGTIILSTGCASRVRLDVPPAPAVAMNTAVVSVVAIDRQCRPIAEALIEQLRNLTGIDVHPGSPTTVNLYGCGITESFAPNNDLRINRHALAAIVYENGDVINLLGSARFHGHIRPREQSSVERVLIAAVAQDLTEQVAPVPMVVRRRLYENAPDGSARNFHNLAVQAEIDGRLTDALRWAQRAHARHPSFQASSYVSELSRRIARTESPHD